MLGFKPVKSRQEKKNKQKLQENSKCNEKKNNEIKLQYGKQVEELTKDRMHDGRVLPMRLADDLSNMSRVEENEFTLWSESEILECKVRTVMKY